MLVILFKSCKTKYVVHYYPGSFNTNYIIFRNVEDFKIKQKKKLVKENIESSRIFYLSKWNFQNEFVIWQQSVKPAKVLGYLKLLSFYLK